MADAKQREAWNHTATLAATICNASGNFKKPVEPKNFHPFKDTHKPAPTQPKPIKADISILKMFVPKPKL